MQFSIPHGYAHRNNRFTMYFVFLIVSCVTLAGLASAGCRISKRNTSVKGGNSKPHFSTPEQCLRECKEDEPPKTCYYHFTFEHYPVLGGACNLCTPNSTNSISSNCQCILANGVERIMLAANRMLPGPSIQVCKGDRIVADIHNKLTGMETTVHWHGVFQNGSQYYDGVPSLTQCPIGEGNTFRYDFIAGNEGTHFWHSHVGLQKMDGLTGSLIIRHRRSEDPNSHLYDYDLSEHVIFINDWMNLLATERFPGTVNIRPGQTPDSILINGKGQWRDPVSGNVTNTTSEVFTVKSGHRYKMRIIGATCTVCPIDFTILGHTLTLIELDGVAIKPKNVTTITMSSGERAAFVLNANQRPGAYWIQVRGLGECGINRIQQTAILRYKGITGPPLSAEPTYDQARPIGLVFNPLNYSCNSDNSSTVCLKDLVNAYPVNSDIARAKPDRKYYLPFKFYQYTPQELYQPNTYNTFLVSPNGLPLVPIIDSITFAFPPSPPLSQLSDIPPYTFCNGRNLTKQCSGPVCKCTNTYDVPLNSVSEYIIVDEMAVTNLSHPFHMHGGTFYVVGMGILPNVTKITAKAVQEYDSKYTLKRNLNRPIAKDTISVPVNGYVILRHHATNPGFWLFHCHFNYHTVSGMDFAIRVGDASDLPPIPKGFPKCGDWKPSIGY